MCQSLKSFIKRILPTFFVDKLKENRISMLTRKAKSIFAQAPDEPAWLDASQLPILQDKYAEPPTVDYDDDGFVDRAEPKANELLQLIRDHSMNVKSSLELGCMDGMVNCFLQDSGIKAIGIDHVADKFDKRAAAQGVKLFSMDAGALTFDDETFDFVFSYDALEHFSDPVAVLQEAIRVLKPGGYVYLVSGPLGLSPYGLHGYRSVTVPYCQMLFTQDVLQEFIKSKQLVPIRFDYINDWSISQFRALWKQHEKQLKVIVYREYTRDLFVELIENYPSCFKHKTKNFDDLIISSLDILLRKTGK